MVAVVSSSVRSTNNNDGAYFVKGTSMALQKERGPLVPAITGLRGRPRKASGKDPKQKSLSSFLVSTSNNEKGEENSLPIQNCKYGPATSSFVINPSIILCWGFWNETVSVQRKVMHVKSLLDDQRNGREWCCEPQTQSIIIHGSEEYSVNGCF